MAPLPAGALALGFLVALIAPAAPAPPPPPSAPTLTVVNPANLPQLAADGRLQYLSIRPDGTRVYHLDLGHGQSVELWDTAPYAIQLTGGTP